MKDDISLLNLMIADMVQQQGVHQASGYWTRHTNKIRKAIMRYGLKNFRSMPEISRAYGDPPFVYDPVDLLPTGSPRARALRLLRRLPLIKYLQKGFYKINKANIAELNRYKDLYISTQLHRIGMELLPGGCWPDTLAGNPNCTVKIGDTAVGQANLRSMVEIRDCGQAVDFGAVRVAMEIGGGIGAYTHMLLHCYSGIRKFIYLDIPPVLYVSTQYLRNYFGDAVIDYRRSASMEKITFQENDELEIYCIAPWQLPLVESSINYFWNSASFQEMPEEVVDNYAQQVGRLKDAENFQMALYVYDRHDDNTLSYETILKLFDSSGISLDRFMPEDSCGIVQKGRHYVSAV